MSNLELDVQMRTEQTGVRIEAAHVALATWDEESDEGGINETFYS